MGLGGLVAAPLLLQTRPLLCVGRRVESWACIQQPIKKYTTIDQLEFKGGLRQIMVWIGKNAHKGDSYRERTEKLMWLQNIQCVWKESARKNPKLATTA